MRLGATLLCITLVGVVAVGCGGRRGGRVLVDAGARDGGSSPPGDAGAVDASRPPGVDAGASDAGGVARDAGPASRDAGAVPGCAAIDAMQPGCLDCVMTFGTECAAPAMGCATDTPCFMCLTSSATSTCDCTAIGDCGTSTCDMAFKAFVQCVAAACPVCAPG